MAPTPLTGMETPACSQQGREVETAPTAWLLPALIQPRNGPTEQLSLADTRHLSGAEAGSTAYFESGLKTKYIRQS